MDWPELRKIVFFSVHEHTTQCMGIRYKLPDIETRRISCGHPAGTQGKRSPRGPAPDATGHSRATEQRMRGFYPELDTSAGAPVDAHDVFLLSPKGSGLTRPSSSGHLPLILRGRKRWRLLDLILVLLLGWGAGMGFFAASAARIQQTSDSADAIIVLTGGADRIEAGFDLLKSGRARTLMISGVHPDVRDSEVKARWTGPPSDYECCVRLGRSARDTFGNANEVAAFLRAENARSAIVVTADYHLPRALLLIERAAGDLELKAFPVRAARARAAQWWSDAGAFLRVSLEFLKYCAIATRELVSRRPVWPLALSATKDRNRRTEPGPPAPDDPDNRWSLRERPAP